MRPELQEALALMVVGGVTMTAFSGRLRRLFFQALAQRALRLGQVKWAFRFQRLAR
jgi:hypothetical protein